MRLAYSLVYRFVWDSISGYTFANLKLATITLAPVFSRFRSHHFRPSCLVVSLHTASVRLLKNESITRMSHRHLPKKTQQTNSEAKHQTIYSLRSRICKSTPGRISFELFRQCPPSPNKNFDHTHAHFIYCLIWIHDIFSAVINTIKTTKNWCFQALGTNSAVHCNWFSRLVKSDSHD